MSNLYFCNTMPKHPRQEESLEFQEHTSSRLRPISSGVMASSDNSDKYDRQLRLWGGNGQRALMNSKVLLINADAAGTEALKNLVLPGVGQFEILDSSNVTPVDVSNNFFVTADALGKPRGEVARELLVEMNPDVVGTSRVESVEALLKSDSAYFSGFSVIVASNVSPAVAIALSDLCDASNTPLVALQSMGFLGTCRVQTRGHEIVESHPESALVDLGLTTCFPQLEEHCAGLDLAAMSSMERSHVPYIVLLHLALKRWKSEHNGSLPGNLAEKKQFAAEYVKPLGRSDDVNVEEAVREACRAYVRGDLTAVPLEVVELVDAQRGRVLSNVTSPFGWCVRALQCYMDLHQPKPVTVSAGSESVFTAVERKQTPEPAVQELSLSEGLWSPRLRALLQSRHEAAARSGSPCGLVPLSGFVPDMHSTTAGFIDLQKIYAARAAADKEVFSLILRDLLAAQDGHGLGGEEALAAVVPTETVDIFCKNIFHLRRLDTSKLSAEFAEGAGRDRLRAVCQETQWELFDDEAQTPLLWYLALKALELHYLRQGEGEYANPIGGVGPEADAAVDAVWGQLSELMKSLGEGEGEGEGGFSLPVSRSHVQELVRLGAHNSQLHTVSSFVGGVASQEVIKLLTHQFIPMNNTFVFNGVCGCGACYTF